MDVTMDSLQKPSEVMDNHFADAFSFHNYIEADKMEDIQETGLGTDVLERASSDALAEPLSVASQVDAKSPPNIQTLETSSSTLATPFEKQPTLPSPAQQRIEQAPNLTTDEPAPEAGNSTNSPHPPHQIELPDLDQPKTAASALQEQGPEVTANSQETVYRDSGEHNSELLSDAVNPVPRDKHEDPSNTARSPASPLTALTKLGEVTEDQQNQSSASTSQTAQDKGAFVPAGRQQTPGFQHYEEASLLEHSEFDMPINAEDALTKGSLRRIYGGEEVSEPTVQCVLVKPMPDNGQGGQRYRVVWSDSENYIQSMITQQKSYMVTENKLQKGSICKLKQYQANVVKDKTILIIIDVEVLEEYGEPPKIGNPAALDGPKEGSTETKPQTENINGNNFYGKQNGNTAPPQARALPTRTSSSHGNITPIEAVSPYSHKWTIKARCTHKGPIKKWHKNTGEGQLFSCNFLDETGEIRATGFNAEVDKLYELIQEGNVYYVTSPCKVVFAKRQFSNVNNDYELTFERDTVVEQAADMDGVPQVRYNFTTLADLQGIEKDTTIDCIGVLQDIGEVSEIVSKTTSKPYQKRELSIVDNTGFSCRLTIWGAAAQTFEADPSSVVAFKGVKVSDFGGRSLSLLASGSMNINPDIEDAYKLKGWYTAEGNQTQFQTHINSMSTGGATSGGRNQDYKTIGQVGEENLGMNPTGDADWFTIKGTVLYIRKENVSYPACRTEGCNKKVISTDPNEWRCEKCDKTWDKPQWRYVLSVNVGDHTGQLWVSCFDDTGKLIMGVTADEIQTMREEDGGDAPRADNLFAAATCKSYIFRCKAKMDNFNDQQRVRYQVQTASMLNYGVEANKLANLIKQYDMNDGGSSLFV